MRWLLLFMLLSANTSALDSPQLILASDVYCPYTCDPRLGEEGYMMALTRALLVDQPIQIKHVLTPWSRALQQMHTGQIDGIVGISKARAGNWLVSPPLGYDGITFFSSKPILPDQLDPSDLRWLDALRLGQVAALTLGDGPFDRYMEVRMAGESPNVVALSGLNPVTYLLRMLHAGRIDVLADNAEVVRFTRRKIGLQGKVYSLGAMQARSLHLALAPTAANSLLMAAFSAQLAQWRKDGRLAVLMAEYGLSDWEVSALEGVEKDLERP